MRKTPLRPGAKPLKARKPLARGRRPLAPRNPERRAREFERAYGGADRVEFVKALRCVACVLTHPLLAMTIPSFGMPPNGCQNCHTVTGGKGRKANADAIVPMCGLHHRQYDEHTAPLDNPTLRARIKAAAASVESMWRAHVAAQGAA